MSGPCTHSTGSAASSTCWGSGCLCRWAALTCCSCKLPSDAAERAGEKRPVRSGGLAPCHSGAAVKLRLALLVLAWAKFQGCLCPAHVPGRSQRWLDDLTLNLSHHCRLVWPSLGHGWPRLLSSDMLSYPGLGGFSCTLSVKWLPPPALPITFHPWLAFLRSSPLLLLPDSWQLVICIQDTQEYHSVAYNVNAELDYQAQGMTSEIQSDLFSNAQKIWLYDRVNVSESVSRSWKLLFKNGDFCITHVPYTISTV